MANGNILGCWLTMTSFCLLVTLLAAATAAPIFDELDCDGWQPFGKDASSPAEFPYTLTCNVSPEGDTITCKFMIYKTR